MVLLGLMLTLAVADGPAQDLKPFDFMGYVAGEPISPKELKKCGKGGDVSCINPLVKVSNVYVGYMLETHDYKLSTLYIDAHPNSYSALLEAFSAKYGKPCESTTAVWRNAAGAQIDNPTLNWCFATGKLSFAKYGSRIDKMAIFYEDANKRPKPTPVINF